MSELNCNPQPIPRSIAPNNDISISPPITAQPENEATAPHYLGTDSKFSSPTARSQKLTKAGLAAMTPKERRFFLQAMARELLPDERVAGCMRNIAPYFAGQGVDIMKSHTTGQVRYRNLLICASIWSCPPCAARLTERRREELTQALAHCPYQPVLLTLTLRHQTVDTLPRLLVALREAWAAFTGGKQWQGIKALYGWVGFVRSLEVTHGDHGWHPHYHVLVFLARRSPVVEIDGLSVEFVAVALQTDLRKRWTTMLQKQGFDASWDRGLTVETTYGRIAEYVAKMGYEPHDNGWNLEKELTKGPSKLAIDKNKGRSPFQLLADYGCGELLAGDLFKDYFYAMKGSKQLFWSPGLRKLLGINDEQDDQTVVESPLAADEVVYANLDAEQWRDVVRFAARGIVLEKAEFYGQSDEFWVWLRDFMRRCRTKTKELERTGK